MGGMNWKKRQKKHTYTHKNQRIEKKIWYDSHLVLFAHQFESPLSIVYQVLWRQRLSSCNASNNKIKIERERERERMRVRVLRIIVAWILHAI